MKHIIILSEDKMTQFMQDADIFEKWKVWAHALEISFNKEDDRTFEERLKKLQDSAKETGFTLVAFFAPNHKDKQWMHPEVKVISNGNNWQVLKDYIASFMGA